MATCARYKCGRKCKDIPEWRDYEGKPQCWRCRLRYKIGYWWWSLRPWEPPV
jgi:hypothetical protein